MAILASGRLVAERGLRPFADQFAGLEIVGGEGGVGGVDRIERRVERDDQKAGLARLLDRRHDRRGIARHDQKPLAPAAISSRWPRPGRRCRRRTCRQRLRRDAEFLGLGLGAFLHLDEEGVVVGLGDEADDVAGIGRATHEGKRQRRGRDGHEEQSRNLGHRFPPDEANSATSIITAHGGWTQRPFRLATVSRRRSSIGQTFGQESTGADSFRRQRWPRILDQNSASRRQIAPVFTGVDRLGLSSPNIGLAPLVLLQVRSEVRAVAAH